MSTSHLSLSNSSQVLLRNKHLLTANYPLFVNMPEDGFIHAYIELNPDSNISCHNNNFIDYQTIRIKHDDSVNVSFDSVYKTQLSHDLVIIAFPKSKDELAFTLAMTAKYLTKDSKILLVGEKKSGVQSSIKLSQHFLLNCHKVDAARHCLLFAGTVKEEVIEAPFNIDEWFTHYDITLNDIQIQIASLPGVFSQKKLDLGTALLLNNLPPKITGKVLDFGCGGGVISCFIGKRFPNTELSLLDVSSLALTSAEKTLELNGLEGKVFASNSLSNVTDNYQYIVSNPPFHQGLKTHYQATEDFLSGIKKHMITSGCITIVANSFLRYQSIMQQYIGKTERVINKQGFAIYKANK